MRRTILLLAVLALTVGAAWRRGDAYILRYGKTQVIRTSTTINQLVPLQRRLGEGSYLWVRIDSREWLSRDEALLREAAAFWAPVEALSPEQHAVDEEERRLDKRIDAIEDGKAKAEPGELARLRDRNAVVSRRQRELDEHSEALEKVAEAKLRQLVDEAIRDGRAKELR
jgi:predicted transcriptional regulator